MLWYFWVKSTVECDLMRSRPEETEVQDGQADMAAGRLVPSRACGITLTARVLGTLVRTAIRPLISLSEPQDLALAAACTAGCVAQL